MDRHRFDIAAYDAVRNVSSAHTQPTKQTQAEQTSSAEYDAEALPNANPYDAAWVPGDLIKDEVKFLEVFHFKGVVRKKC